jgi:ribosomal protein S13
MLITAKKCLQDKPIVKKFPRKDKNSCLNWLCHDVYGINYKTAKKIVDELEISTLEDLFALEHYRLTAIDGIGDKIADKIMRSIENES